MSNIETAIYDVIASKKNVSFAELSAIEGFDGEYSIEIEENAVLWSGVSKPAVEAMRRLLLAKRIRFQLTEPLAYAIDGKMLRLPIASSLPPYRKPVWIPVVFNAA